MEQERRFIENKTLLKDILRRNYYSHFQQNDSKKNIEFLLSNTCNQNCEHCYLSHETAMYPNSNYQNNDYKKTLINLQSLLNWYNDNEFKCDIILSGNDWLNDKTFYEKILNTFQTFEFKYTPKNIIIYSNLLFLLDNKQTDRIKEFITIMQKNRNINIQFQIFLNGKYCDNDMYSDEFYQKMFNFLSITDYLIHAFITPTNVSGWIENYKWWIRNLKDQAFSHITLTELTCDSWTKENLSDFIQFIDFQTDFLKECIVNFEWLIFNQNEDYKFINTQLISQQILNNVNSHQDCNFHNSVVINVKNLTLLLCDKINYPDFIIGTFVEENGQITDLEPNNMSLIILKAHLKRSSTPHCETCDFLELCDGFCYGAAYEKTYNPLLPIKEKCDLIKSKYIYLIYKYNLLGYFNNLETYSTNASFNKYIRDVIEKVRQGL